MNVLVGVTQHRDSHMTRFLKALGLARGTTVNVMHVIEFPPFMKILPQLRFHDFPRLST